MSHPEEEENDVIDDFDQSLFASTLAGTVMALGEQLGRLLGRVEKLESSSDRLTTLLAEMENLKARITGLEEARKISEQNQWNILRKSQALEGDLKSALDTAQANGVTFQREIGDLKRVIAETEAQVVAEKRKNSELEKHNQQFQEEREADGAIIKRLRMTVPEMERQAKLSLAKQEADLTRRYKAQEEAIRQSAVKAMRKARASIRELIKAHQGSLSAEEYGKLGTGITATFSGIEQFLSSDPLVRENIPTERQDELTTSDGAWGTMRERMRQSMT